MRSLLRRSTHTTQCGLDSSSVPVQLSRNLMLVDSYFLTVSLHLLPTACAVVTGTTEVATSTCVRVTVVHLGFRRATRDTLHFIHTCLPLRARSEPDCSVFKTLVSSNIISADIVLPPQLNLFTSHGGSSVPRANIYFVTKSNYMNQNVFKISSHG